MGLAAVAHLGKKSQSIRLTNIRFPHKIMSHLTLGLAQLHGEPRGRSAAAAAPPQSVAAAAAAAAAATAAAAGAAAAGAAASTRAREARSFLKK